MIPSFVNSSDRERNRFLTKLKGLKTLYSYDYDLIVKKYLNDLDIAIVSALLDERIIAEFPSNITSNPLFWKTLLGEKGEYIEICPEIYKNNSDIAMNVLLFDGSLLRHFDQAIRHDQFFGTLAIRKDAGSILYANPKFIDDFSFAYSALGMNLATTSYISKTLLEDEAFVNILFNDLDNQFSKFAEKNYVGPNLTVKFLLIDENLRNSLKRNSTLLSKFYDLNPERIGLAILGPQIYNLCFPNCNESKLIQEISSLTNQISYFECMVKFSSGKSFSYYCTYPFKVGDKVTVEGKITEVGFIESIYQSRGQINFSYMKALKTVNNISVEKYQIKKLDGVDLLEKQYKDLVDHGGYDYYSPMSKYAGGKDRVFPALFYIFKLTTLWDEAMKQDEYKKLFIDFVNLDRGSSSIAILNNEKMVSVLMKHKPWEVVNNDIKSVETAKILCALLAKNEFAINLKQEENNLHNKLITFAATGKLENFTREGLKNFIEQNGHKLLDKISLNVNFLINNDKNSASTKNNFAKENNIPILTEIEFIDMIGSKTRKGEK